MMIYHRTISLAFILFALVFLYIVFCLLYGKIKQLQELFKLNFHLKAFAALSQRLHLGRHFIKLIEDEIEEIKNENPNEDDISALLGIKSKFEQAVLVGIEVDTNKDAYMLFESLNHRGVPLSALDLIKNTLIARAATEAEAENSYELWKQILSNVGQDDYAVQERFFRQYYNAFREELNAPYKVADKKYYLGYFATRTTLLDIYEKMIKSDDYATLLEDLVAKSKK